eukprot:gene1431-32804_t
MLPSQAAVIPFLVDALKGPQAQDQVNPAKRAPQKSHSQRMKSPTGLRPGQAVRVSDPLAVRRKQIEQFERLSRLMNVTARIGEICVSATCDEGDSETEPLNGGNMAVLSCKAIELSFKSREEQEPVLPTVHEHDSVSPVRSGASQDSTPPRMPSAPPGESTYASRNSTFAGGESAHAGGNSTFTGGASAHAGGNSTHASRTKETWEHSSEAGGIDPESSHSHARECEIEVGLQWREMSCSLLQNVQMVMGPSPGSTEPQTPACPPGAADPRLGLGPGHTGVAVSLSVNPISGRKIHSPSLPLFCPPPLAPAPARTPAPAPATKARSPSTFEDLSRLSSMEPSGGESPPWTPPAGIHYSEQAPTLGTPQGPIWTATPPVGIHHSGQGPPLGTPQGPIWTATPPVGIHPSGEFPHPETGTPAMPVPGSFHRDEMASGSTPLGMSPTLGGSYMEAPLGSFFSVQSASFGGRRGQGVMGGSPQRQTSSPQQLLFRAQPTLFPDPPTVNKISKHQGLIIPSAPNASDQQSQPQGPPTAPLVQGGPGRQPHAHFFKKENNNTTDLAVARCTDHL